MSEFGLPFVASSKILEYWKQDKFKETRYFSPTEVGRDWPTLTGSPCAVVIHRTHARKKGGRKVHGHFARLLGKCKICKDTKFEFIIEENPFIEERKLESKQKARILKKKMGMKADSSTSSEEDIEDIEF